MHCSLIEVPNDCPSKQKLGGNSARPAYNIAARMPPNTPATTPSCPTAKGSAALEVVEVRVVVVEPVLLVLELVDVMTGVESTVLDGTGLEKHKHISSE
jgi:hypothetical protein